MTDRDWPMGHLTDEQRALLARSRELGAQVERAYNLYQELYEQHQIAKAALERLAGADLRAQSIRRNLGVRDDAHWDRIMQIIKDEEDDND